MCLMFPSQTDAYVINTFESITYLNNYAVSKNALTLERICIGVSYIFVSIFRFQCSVCLYKKSIYVLHENPFGRQS